MSNATDDLAQRFKEQAEKNAQDVKIGEQKSRRMGTFKLVVAIGIVLMAILLFDIAFNPFWLLIPIAFFIFLLRQHERIDNVLWQAQAREALYRDSLVRLDGKWRGAFEKGEAFIDTEHPFASDLDLFGHGGLFEYLCRAKTPFGQERLAQWLKSPPLSPQEIQKRQSIVKALENDPALLEKIAEASAITQRKDNGWRITKRKDKNGLRRWAKENEGFHVVEQALAALLVIGTIAVFVLWGLGTLTITHAAGALVVEGIFALYLRKRVQPILSGAASADRYLGVLSELLKVLENAGPEHAALKTELLSGESALGPSAALAKLSSHVARAEQMQNAFFLPFALVLMWGSHAAFSLARWRQKHGAQVAAWLEASAQLEAYHSLAVYARLWPEGLYPKVLDEPQARFSFTQLAHPLIDAEGTLLRGGIANDVALGDGVDAPKLMVVSGSNMSGKSTLLRSVGSAMILARLGTKVSAQEARFVPMRIGASLLVHDSLGTGTSRFYAELLRLKQVVDLARDENAHTGLLYFMDEVLSGTNSHDRQIGAQALMRELVQRRALGFVTTHDLSLTTFDPPLAGAVNKHFVDEFRDGRLHFDYTLREGVVDRSNAVALMESLELLQHSAGAAGQNDAAS